MALKNVGKIGGRIAAIGLLVVVLFLPLVVTAGKPAGPGGASRSKLIVTEDIVGTLFSPNAPTSRTIEADGKLWFVSVEFGGLSPICGRARLDLTGPHSGHLKIELDPTRKLAWFSFRFYEDLDRDGIDDHVLLQTPTSFPGTRSVEIISKNHLKATFNCQCELLVAYRNPDGSGCGNALFPWLYVVIEIMPA